MNNIVGLSKIGLVRKQNEDRFFISDNICAVTDGMGGYRGGEIASTYAVDEIKEYLQSTPTINETSLVDAILHANTRIVNRVAREERLSGMGTTAVVVAKVDDNLLWASVGDSRLYIYRNDEFTQITKEEMIVHPQRNLLTRAVGVEEDLHVDSGTLPVKSGDRILLCTDGLSGYISDERIREVLHHIDDNTEVLNTLIADVYDAGAGDNVTIIVGTI